MEKPKKRQGFAVMDPARLAEITAAGGRAAHALGKAHRYTSDEARAAGDKGRATQRLNNAARLAAKKKTPAS